MWFYYVFAFLKVSFRKNAPSYNFELYIANYIILLFSVRKKCTNRLKVDIFFQFCPFPSNTFYIYLSRDNFRR